MTDFTGQYVSHIFFAYRPGAGFDILADLCREDDDNWVFHLRTRTDAGSTDPFDGSASKKHHRAVFSGDEDKVLAKVTDVFRGAAKIVRCTVVEVIPIRSSDPNALLKALAGKPWAHIKTEGHA